MMMTHTTAVGLATLVPITDDAARSLGGRASLRITHFPFKFGRESRSNRLMARVAHALDRRARASEDLNDVYLIEPASSVFLFISREHFAIDCIDGHYFLVDRGSACGTIVGGRQVGGGRRGERAELENGDLIVIGTSESPFRFRFDVSTANVG